MAELVVPDVAFQESWLESLAEWGPVPQDGSGYHEGEHDVHSAEGFAAWVRYLRDRSDPSTPMKEGFVHATHWWIVEGGEYLGAITLRHSLTEKLLDGGGHIGYGVRPSARGRGLAGWALGEVVKHARKLGLERVMVSCDDANIASAKTIERNGGVLEDIRETWLGTTRRYWITT
ncbi:GNAT family N-acetyltransferase [Kribbella sp. NPDC056345]|uniref:GNAT family N-acetyltransferase n=1 Tax=Kribbella sp. NPDC056345 TaxID=3345789 RepID=UPI0035E2DFFD